MIFVAIRAMLVIARLQLVKVVVCVASATHLHLQIHCLIYFVAGFYEIAGIF